VVTATEFNPAPPVPLEKACEPPLLMLPLAGKASGVLINVPLNAISTSGVTVTQAACDRNITR